MATTPTYIPTTEQKLIMDETWTEELVTASNTVGTIGMYGDEGSDSYWFYLKFSP